MRRGRFLSPESEKKDTIHRPKPSLSIPKVAFPKAKTFQPSPTVLCGSCVALPGIRGAPSPDPQREGCARSEREESGVDALGGEAFEKGDLVFFLEFEFFEAAAFEAFGRSEVESAFHLFDLFAEVEVFAA